MLHSKVTFKKCNLPASLAGQASAQNPKSRSVRGNTQHSLGYVLVCLLSTSAILPEKALKDQPTKGSMQGAQSLGPQHRQGPFWPCLQLSEDGPGESEGLEGDLDWHGI